MPICRSRTFLAIQFFILLAPFAALGQSAGDNVNMVSGTGWTNGDPFLQRQNEPSMAVSTRNTLHLLAGANDYRNVDVPGLLGIDVQGDAWVGLFKSFDGGQTWQSTLLPGYPLDSSPQGTASPIHGFQAAADPVVRAGTNGLFYYSGIAFNRGTGGLGVVFVSRFIDNNNKENGDPTNTNGSLTNLAPTDPIEYLGTSVVGRGTSTTFLDKPWIATDIPRGTTSCQIPYTKSDGTTGTQTIPAGRVFATYAALNGTATSDIVFSYSNDCGVTWSSPVTLSQKKTLNQGAMIAVAPTYDEDNDNDSDPGDTIVYVAWRMFGAGKTPAALMIAKSSDGGQSFSKPVAAVTFPASCNNTPTGSGCIFDQGTSGSTFRTTAYPAITVDDTGRVYLAWSQRQASGDARIMMSVSSDGLNWSSSPALVDNGPVFDDSGIPFSNLSGHGHQLMPSLTFSAGKLSLLYFDFREDHTLGFYTIKPDLTGYNETRQFEGELVGNPGSNLVFNSYVSDAAPPLTSRRHTIDVQGAEATPLPTGSLGVPAFNSFRVSRYLFGINPFDNSNQAEQLQVDSPDLPMFEQGSVPFFGDYLDLAPTPAYVLDGGTWKFNTNAANLPVYHAVWTDNRDVVPPPDGNWTHYVPPFSASNPSGSHPSLFDPTQTVPQCQVGVNDGFTASRNQNIYTSIIAPGLVVGSLGNSKPLGYSAANPTQLLQRAFEVTLRNTTTLQRSFRIMIGNQPALATGQPDPQGQASLLQNILQTSLDVTIPPQSSIARAVFIQSANPTASVTVNAQEINAPGGALVSGGLQGFVTFNPDPSAPLLLDPDNVGFTNPTILSAEVHTPAIANPAIANPAIANPAIANPAIANPAIANPAIANPAIANPAVVAALNPAIANPAIANPAIANPAIANPAIANQSVTDAVYPFTNVGNTTTSYAVKLFQKAPLPPGINLQLILTKQFLTPVAQGCDLKEQIQNVIVANITNPVFTAAANLGDPDLPDPAVTNATLALEPGETGQIVIRANVSSASDMQNLVLNNLVPVGVAHASNTGVAIPPATLTILNQTLPDGVVGTVYNAQVNLFGGVGAYTVSVTNGALPPGLNIDAGTGAITGAPTAAGNFPFTVQVTDSATTPSIATQAFTIRIANPLVLTTPTSPDGVVSAAYSLSLSASGGIGNQTWSLASGSLPLGLTLSTAGVISGIPTQANSTGSSFTVQVQDSGSPAQISSISFTIHIAPVLTITTTAGQLPDAVIGSPYSFTFASNGGITPIQWTLASGTLPPGLTLGTGGALTGTPTSPGNYTFTVQAGDSSSPAQTITLSVGISSPAALVINTAGGALPDAVAGAPYNFPLSFTGGTAPLNWTVSGGLLPAGLNLSSAGVISGTPLAANASPVSFTIQVQDGGSPAQSKTLNLTLRVAAPLLINTSAGSLPDSVQNVPYTLNLATSGGIVPLAWSVTSGSLPPGINLSSAGAITGVPSSTGTYNFTAQLQDASNPIQIRTVALSLRVAAPLAISTPSGSLPDAVQGTSYTNNLLSSGGIAPLVWSISAGQLPPGLTMSAAGVLSGSPVAAGTYSFTAQLQDASNPPQMRSVTLSLRVAAPLMITTPAGALPNAVVKIGYSVTLAASGGNAPIAWSLASGALPPGLTLNSGGKISGTPTQTGTFTFTVKVGDGSSPQQVKAASFSIKVGCYDPDHDGDCEDRD
jgi:Putative Ig domain